MHQHSVATALTMLLATAPSAMAGLYSKKSPVLQVDSKSFNRLINQSNYTSVRNALAHPPNTFPRHHH